MRRIYNKSSSSKSPTINSSRLSSSEDDCSVPAGPPPYPLPLTPEPGVSEVGLSMIYTDSINIIKRI